jgi:hypothetical protein
MESGRTERIGDALQDLEVGKKHKVIKSMHGWLHTVTRRIRLQKEAQSTCPRCGKTGEDQAHIL